LVAVEELFLSVVILLAAARLFGELFRRIGQPALGGELLAGMILGPSLFGIVSSNESLEMLSSIAIFFVLLFIGLEMDIRQVKKTGKPAVVLSITSLILPFVAGYGISVLFGIEIIPSLFIGLLLSVTSVPVSAMILVELGILKSKIGTTVLSAAVVDDIISLVILAVILQFAQSGGGAIDMNTIDWNAIGISGLKIAIFLVGIGFLAYLVHKINIWFPKRLEWFFVKAKTREATFGILIVLAITISLLAQYADLHFIIGTFFAGLIFSERLLGKKEADHAYGIVSGITFGFFAPLFFAIIGMKFSGQSLADSIPYLLMLIGAAMATKTIGGYLGARLFKFNNIESLALASLLNGRGTVGLAITALAFSVGILDIMLYSVAVSICFITTMLTPVLAKPFLRRVEVIRSEIE
jgi:Kef-type K+ transport system membrane component KefB